LETQISFPAAPLLVVHSLTSCSMHRHCTLAVSSFQTHSRLGDGRQKAVFITPQTGTFTLQSL